MLQIAHGVGFAALGFNIDVLHFIKRARFGINPMVSIINIIKNNWRMYCNY